MSCDKGSPAGQGGAREVVADVARYNARPRIHEAQTPEGKMAVTGISEPLGQAIAPQVSAPATPAIQS